MQSRCESYPVRGGAAFRISALLRHDTRGSYPRRARRRAPGQAIALIAAVLTVAVSCVRRDIFAPLPEAIQVTIPDTSIATVMAASAEALTDRGLTVQLTDEEHGTVESRYVDIAAVRTDVDAGTAIGIERTIRFRFRAIPSFGAISLYGEVVYQLGDFGGRATERMVPENHPARPVLIEMMRSIADKVAIAKAARSAQPPDR